MDAKELSEVFGMMKETNSELERLRSLNKELARVLELAHAICKYEGYEACGWNKMSIIEAALAKAKEQS